MSIPETIWRQYDIRGIVPEEVNPDLAQQIGKAFGTLVRRTHGGNSVVVGHDARLTSHDIKTALIKGIQDSGCNVLDIGMVPTPVMYFTVAHFQHDAGIVVTASHNPPEYNGFKMRTYERALYGEDIQQVARIVREGDFESGEGFVETFDVLPTYIEYISKNISLTRPLKIVLDAGNGIAGPTSVKLFESLGCEVIPLFCEPDGNFPNHIPDPTVPDNMISLREKVISSSADIGIGFDGDGDRVAVMSSSGELLLGDRMLSIFLDSVLKDKSAPVVFDVKCSIALIEEIKQKGGEPVMGRTGYPLMQAKMKEVNAPLAGEMSGHMYFADRYYGFDDGIYAGCRFVELLSNSDRGLNDMVNSLPSYPSTPELRLHCSEEAKFKVIEDMTNHIEKNYKTIKIDGLRFTTSSGWGLLRASNTEPAIVARFEAKSKEELKNIISDAIEILKTTPVDIEPLHKALVEQ